MKSKSKYWMLTLPMKCIPSLIGGFPLLSLWIATEADLIWVILQRTPKKHCSVNYNSADLFSFPLYFDGKVCDDGNDDPKILYDGVPKMLHIRYTA